MRKELQVSQRKPRGQIGYIEIGSDVAYHAVQLPHSKEEIEQWVLNHTLAAARAGGSVDPYRLVSPPVRNTEADFDFTLPTATGTEHLDLQEIVVLPKGARGYEDGHPVYDAEAMAKAVFQKVSQKSKHYGKPRSPTHLLLYATDWRFRLVGSVVRHLILLLAGRKHVFVTVSYFTPDDEESGEFISLYPVPSELLAECAQWHQAARQTGRRELIIVADPRAARLDASGHVIFPNPLATRK
jgi:hypothetical protein